MHGLDLLRLERMGHPALRVSNLSVSEEFYTKVLGMRLRWDLLGNDTRDVRAEVAFRGLPFLLIFSAVSGIYNKYAPRSITHARYGTDTG